MRASVVIALVTCGCGRWGFGGTGGDDVVVDDASMVRDNGAIIDAPGDMAMAAIDAMPCGGTTHMLTDNFDDNTLDATKWGNAYEDSSSRHVETGGRLEIRLGANVPDNWAGYVSTTLYDLHDDRVFVEVPVVNALTGDAILLLWTSFAKTDGPSIEYERGKLIFRRRVAGTINDLSNVTYNATMHRWWQIREHGGTTYWETSPDGVSWTPRQMQTTPGATTALITIAAGTGNSEPADLVVFDNLNGGGAPPLCP